MDTVVGLDLGQSGDPAAAAVVQRGGGWCAVEDANKAWGLRDDANGEWRRERWRDKAAAVEGAKQLGLRMKDDKLRCVSLRRWPLNTPYTLIVQDTVDLGFDALVPDYCGVGRPVVDFLRQEMMKRKHQGKLFPIVTVGSNARGSLKPGHRSIPKIELCSSIAIAQEQKRLALPQCEETPQLLSELASYRMRFSKAANLEFGNDPGKGKHDDLVTALGLALWWSLRFGVRKLAVYMG